MKEGYYMKTFKNLIGTEAGKSALVIGNGATIKEYKKQITEFIDTTNCITIGVNNMTAFWTPDYHLWTNNQRFREFGKSIRPNSTLLLGSNISLKVIRRIVGGREYVVLNREDREGVPMVYKDGMIYGYFRSAGCLAIMLLHLMGATEINIVGMDGYTIHKREDVMAGKASQHWYGKGHTDTASWESCLEKDKIIEDALNNIKEYGVDFKILTPTKYGGFYDSTRLHV